VKPELVHQKRAKKCDAADKGRITVKYKYMHLRLEAEVSRFTGDDQMYYLHKISTTGRSNSNLIHIHDVLIDQDSILNIQRSAVWIVIWNLYHSRRKFNNGEDPSVSLTDFDEGVDDKA
jgi:hypothetical protein